MRDEFENEQVRPVRLKNWSHFYVELTYLRLVKLDISGNRISVLPNEMRKMKSLVDFKLSDNPLTSPPASVSINDRSEQSSALLRSFDPR